MSSFRARNSRIAAAPSAPEFFNRLNWLRHQALSSGVTVCALGSSWVRLVTSVRVQVSACGEPATNPLGRAARAGGGGKTGDGWAARSAEVRRLATDKSAALEAGSTAAGSAAGATGLGSPFENRNAT